MVALGTTEQETPVMSLAVPVKVILCILLFRVKLNVSELSKL